MTTLAETILRDVPRYTFDTNGELLYEREVLAALTAALDPALSERAGEVVAQMLDAIPVTQDLESTLQGAVLQEGADLITAALAQNAALRAERDELSSKLEVERALTDAVHRLAKAAEAQIAALTARVEGRE